MEDIEYNENEAINFILKRLPKEEKEALNRDDIDYLLDVIYDFYQESGFLDESANEESGTLEINEQDMVNYVTDRVSADGKNDYITEDVIVDILDGEYEYCKSKGIYE